LADRRPTYRDVEPVRHAVTYEEMQEAKVFVDRTANEFGRLKARSKYEKLVLDALLHRLIRDSDAKTYKMREDDAEASPIYLRQAEQWLAIETQWNQLEAKTKVEYTKIEIWRTISANERIREQSPDSTRERRS
jgi:hypothetical protein